MRLTKRKVGYIGVDVGTSALKVAQVEHGKQGWRLAASAVVPRHEELDVSLGLTTEVVSTLDELRTSRSLQRGYRGRQAAAVLPMGVCDLHRLDRDLSRDPKPEAVLRQAIETATQKSADPLLCDFWSGPAGESTSAWSQAIALPRAWSDRVCEDIARVGWSCDTVDGLPLAITRAVNMVHAGSDGKPVAALDWGNHQATLCFIEKHEPTYVRGLKVDGLNEIVANFVESLEVSQVEAQGLIERYGLTGQASGQLDEVAKLIKEMISKVVDCLEEEIKRSFSHFQFLRRAGSPQQLYLMGGGAMIKGLGQRLTQRLEIPAKNWQLTPTDQQNESVEERAECVLATAIALSALAWEVE